MPTSIHFLIHEIEGNVQAGTQQEQAKLGNSPEGEGEVSTGHIVCNLDGKPLPFSKSKC